MSEKYEGVSKLRNEVKKLREAVDSFSERLHLVEVDIFGEGAPGGPQYCEPPTYKERFGEYPVINNLARISGLMTIYQGSQSAEQTYLNDLQVELNICITELLRQHKYTDRVSGLSASR